LWEPLAAERLQLARLRLATGELEAAIEAAESLDHPQPVVYVAYVAESLRVRVRAAEEQGDAERARQYRARLDRLVGGMD
jgi:Tfp pilus assembly protein PilF